MWNPETPFLVIVKYHDHDVSWADRLNYPHLIYHTDPAKSESSLLKFIHDFYEELPQNLVVVHQYERKFYHDGSLVDLLNNPNFPFRYQASSTKGFWNFNNQLLGSIASQLDRIQKSGWWTHCMEKYFGPITGCCDFTAGKKGCSQFVVSRERIRSLPREFYQNMYDWMVEHTLELESDDPNSSHYMNRYLEWTWELIFTAWKPTETIAQTLPNGKRLTALYGAGSYYRDVTAIFIDNFTTPIGTILMARPNLNAYFGDVVEGTMKSLRIHLDDTTIEINEHHNLMVV